MSFVPERSIEEDFWPYSRGQLDKIPVLLERFKAWKVLIDELIIFFRGLKNLESDFTRRYSKAHGLFTPSRDVSLKMFEFSGEVLSPLFTNIRLLGVEHSSMEHHLKNITLIGLLGIKNEIISGYRNFKLNMDSLNQNIIRSRKDTVKCILDHGRYFNNQSISSNLSKKHHNTLNHHPRSKRHRRFKSKSNNAYNNNHDNKTTISENAVNGSLKISNPSLDVNSSTLSTNKLNKDYYLSNSVNIEVEDEKPDDELKNSQIINTNGNINDVIKDEELEGKEEDEQDKEEDSKDIKVITKRLLNCNVDDLYKEIVVLSASIDPWLQMRDLHSQLFRMINTENDFQKRALSVLSDMQELDKRIMDSIKVIIDQYIRKRGSVNDVITDKLYGIGDIMLSIPSEAPYQAFKARKQLTNEVYKQERTLKDFPFKPPCISIEFEGILLRKSKYSNKWKSMIVVITESGWLHCFNSEFNSKFIKIGGVKLKHNELIKNQNQTFKKTVNNNNNNNSNNNSNSNSDSNLDVNDDNTSNVNKNDTIKENTVIDTPTISIRQSTSLYQGLDNVEENIKEEDEIEQEKKQDNDSKSNTFTSKDLNIMNGVVNGFKTSSCRLRKNDENEDDDTENDIPKVDSTTLLLGGNNIREVPKPDLSICLSQPGVLIRISNDSIYKGNFSIVIQTIKKTIFGKRIKEQIFEFKSLSDYDFLDWITAIKYKAEEPLNIIKSEKYNNINNEFIKNHSCINFIGDTHLIYNSPLTDFGMKPIYRTKLEFDNELNKRESVLKNDNKELNDQSIFRINQRNYLMDQIQIYHNKLININNITNANNNIKKS